MRFEVLTPKGARIAAFGDVTSYRCVCTCRVEGYSTAVELRFRVLWDVTLCRRWGTNVVTVTTELLRALGNDVHKTLKCHTFVSNGTALLGHN